MKLLVLVALLAGCPKSGDKKPADPAPKRDAGHLLASIDDANPSTVQLPPAPPLPRPPAGLPPLPDRPEITEITPELVALGELLFHDPRLSSTGKVSCATCHDPATGYAGGMQANAEGKQNLRRTPTLINLAWAGQLGWDGRYAAPDNLLVSHVRGQLGSDLVEVLAKLASLPLYRAHFVRVSHPDERDKPLIFDRGLTALGAYALTRYSGEAPWDGIESTASLPKSGSTPTIAGYMLFAGKAQCAQCHVPPLYTDQGFHKVAPNPSGDPGRGLVDKASTGMFRTPTLRGATARPSFFHAGSAKTLEEVVDHYITASRTQGAGYDPLIAKIALTPIERDQLLVFLRALSGTVRTPAKPALP